jgi:hypothetical protein
VNGLLAPLDLVQPGVLVGDRGFGHAASHVIDEHGSGRRDRLQPRRRVDRVAQHHPLALGAELHRGVAGQDAGADAELGHLDLLAERSDRLGQRQRSPHGPLGVVLARDGGPPHRHHRVADELLDRPAIPLDQRPAVVEIAAQQVSHLFGVAVLAEGREPDQVSEQNRHQPPLGGRRLSGLERSRSALRSAQRAPAFPAKPVGWLVDRAARRTLKLERGPALGAESPPRPVFRTARRAIHRRDGSARTAG